MLFQGCVSLQPGHNSGLLYSQMYVSQPSEALWDCEVRIVFSNFLLLFSHSGPLPTAILSARNTDLLLIYCIILFYVIIILYYNNMLYYIILYYTIICYVMLYYIMLYYIILCYYIILLYYIMLYYIMLYYIILCYYIILLYYIMLYYIILVSYTFQCGALNVDIREACFRCDLPRPVGPAGLARIHDRPGGPPGPGHRGRPPFGGRGRPPHLMGGPGPAAPPG